MEALAAVGLVGNIVQFVDFGGKLISKSIQLYNSDTGTLIENVDIETATKHLVVLNKRLKDDGIAVGDGTLQSLSLSCQNAAIDLLVALGKVKVNDRQQKWESIRKALRSVWSKDEIRGLEQRLAKLKDDLNLHLVVRLSEQVSQFKRENLDKLGRLDFATKIILDAIAEGQDVFRVTPRSGLTNRMLTLFKLPQPDIAQQERCLDKLSNATQAAFNSSERQHDPTCLDNTRVGVLNEIRAWADGQDERCIYWLNGLAGTGKSTIARTIAREYFEQGRLGASFFFSKGGGDVGHAGKFFTTIAFQLAKKSPSLKNSICSAVSENNDIKNQSLRDQWHQLILQPLARLDGDGDSCRPSYILVVDALDECDGESDIRAILQLLVEARLLKKVQLRVFLTSRPEIPIRHGFYQISDTDHHDFVLHNISPSIVDHDIRVFLEYKFNLIGQERCLNPGWPGEQTTKQLIQKASGLFIWAATACRFVGDGKRFAVKRLAMILEGDNSTTAPEKHLDEIYATVLKQSINPNFTNEETEEVLYMLRQVLGSIVVLFSPLSTDSLRRLLHITKEDVEQTLEDLHAILDIPKGHSIPLRLHHPSFRDFLLNENRCGDPNFWIDEKQAHQGLANNSIELMANSLKQDICSLNTYGVCVTDIDSSRVRQCLPQEVQYACLYWIQHLQRSGCKLYDDSQVHQFLQTHVLHWLEALSWMGKVSEGIHAISSLESIALTSRCPGLFAFIHDIKRFALFGRPGIDQAPLQIYCSALIFAPEMSLVKKQFKNQIPCWIKKLPEVEKDWNAALQTLEGHSKPVNAIAFSSEGNVLASASDDWTVKLWDAGAGAALQTLKGHSDSVHNIVFSPSGKLLASASYDQTVKLWDAGTGAALQTLKGFSHWGNAIAFSPDGKVLAWASDDWTIKLWDVGKRTALQTFKGHSDNVNAICFSPDCKLLASASKDRTIKLWNANTGVAMQTLKGYLGWINAIAFSPDGKVLASASVDRRVKLWDIGKGAALQTLRGHLDYVKAIAFSPDGKILASVSKDWTVKLWDAINGAVLQTLEGYLIDPIVFSPDGKVLVSALDNGTVKLWDVNTGAALQMLKGHFCRVNAIAFSSDGQVLASASADGIIKLWDAGMGAALQTPEGYLARLNTISPDGKVLALISENGLALTSDDRIVKLLDVGTGATLQMLEGHADNVNTISFSPDGKVLASASDDRMIKLWDVGTGAALQTLKGHLDQVYIIAFSSDGKLLASASADGIVNLWDIGAGATLQMHGRDLPYVDAIVFSPEGKVLASLWDDGMIKLWDAGTGAALQTLQMLKSNSIYVDAIAFSPDGKLLASTGEDWTIKLWDVGTGAALQRLKDHSRQVNAIAFSPDGKVLASASADWTVKLWDVRTGDVLQTLKSDTAVQSLLFTEDGKFLKTERGMLRTAAFSLSEVSSRRNLSREIFVKGQWVTRGMENVLWLPSEYRPFRIAVHGNVITFLFKSDRMFSLEFGF